MEENLLRPARRMRGPGADLANERRRVHAWHAGGKPRETTLTTNDERKNDNEDDNEDVVIWRSMANANVTHRRVLVVDDYREAAEALQMLLSVDGFECRALEDPLAVCDLADAWQPFAVVLDIKMPGLDGFELARRLRANPSTGHMLLVACTAFSSAKDLAQAKAVGFDAHCAKPLTPQRLLRLLEAATTESHHGPS
jgi:two-component system, OmpR family, response regulator